MSDDSINVLAGIEGLLSGISSVAVPTINRRLTLQDQYNLERRKQLAEEQIKAREQYREFGYKQQLEAEKTPLDIATYRGEHPTIGSMENIPPEFTGKGYESLTPEEATSLLKSKGENNLSLSLKEQQQQDTLEKQYRDLHTKVLSNRSGGLGLQDAKVNQAIHVRSLLDQYYDSKTGEYNVPRSAYNELAMGVANLVAGGTQVSDSMRNDIAQKTAKGNIGNALTFITGTPFNGTSQGVIKQLADSVDRQGTVSEKLRNQYYQQLKSKAPTRLEQSRKMQVEKEALGSSFSEYLMNSPATKTVNPPGIDLTNDLTSQIQSQLPKGAKIKSIRRID